MRRVHVRKRYVRQDIFNMPSYNKVILIGHLSRDPELKYSAAGKPICKFGLAVNHTWKTESGEKKEDVTFVDIDCFGRTAENVSKYMKKGSALLVEGRLKLDQWDDKQSGQKRSKLGVVAESCQFMGGSKSAPSAPASPASEAPSEDPPF